jgi:hypothetical protein
VQETRGRSRRGSKEYKKSLKEVEDKLSPTTKMEIPRIIPTMEI